MKTYRDNPEGYKGRYYIVYTEQEDPLETGWYCQDMDVKGWPCSGLYETEEQLLEAIQENKIEWE